MHGGSGISRRQVLISGGLAASAPLLSGTRDAPSLLRRPGKAGAPAPAQVHVQFGADAATQAAVSWAAPAAVSRPRLKRQRVQQRAAADWLERELAQASRDRDIDWIVVCMHQVAMSSAHFNGADLAGHDPLAGRPTAGSRRSGGIPADRAAARSLACGTVPVPYPRRH